MPTNVLLISVVLLVTLLLNFHCINEPSSGYIDTIEGLVTDSMTGLPIDNVLVQAVWESMTEDRWLSTYTDAQGYYSLHFSRREDFDFIIYMKDGYCLA
jgi:hypothetical protein